MIIADLAFVALGLLAVWVFGGLLLRLSGIVLALGGIGLVALSGNANGLLVFLIGGALWLAGHWLYVLRHGEYKSPLADFLFYRCAPAWVDPIRDRRTI
jgi:hypothetical protein